MRMDGKYAVPLHLRICNIRTNLQWCAKHTKTTLRMHARTHARKRTHARTRARPHARKHARAKERGCYTTHCMRTQENMRHICTHKKHDISHTLFVQITIKAPLKFCVSLMRKGLNPFTFGGLIHILPRARSHKCTTGFIRAMWCKSKKANAQKLLIALKTFSNSHR